MAALMARLRAIGKRVSRPLRGGERGYLLIEVLVAVAILGVIAVAFLSSLSTGYLALILADENTMAESLTRTTFERIRNAPFGSDPGQIVFPSLPTYEITVTVDNVGDPTLSPVELWTVVVSRPGEAANILTTSTYKVDHNKDLPN